MFEHVKTDEQVDGSIPQRCQAQISADSRCSRPCSRLASCGHVAGSVVGAARIGATSMTTRSLAGLKASSRSNLSSQSMRA